MWHKVFCLVAKFTSPRTIADQAPLSMGISWREYWSGLPFPSPGDLLYTGIKPVSPAWQVILASVLLDESMRWKKRIPDWHLSLTSLWTVLFCQNTVVNTPRFHCKGHMFWFRELRASLVGQLVKNSPAMWETWVWSLGWEGPLEKGKATHSSILAWKIPRTIYSPRDGKESDTTEWLSLSLRGTKIPHAHASWHSPPKRHHYSLCL